MTELGRSCYDRWADSDYEQVNMDAQLISSEGFQIIMSKISNSYLYKPVLLFLCWESFKDLQRVNWAI